MIKSILALLSWNRVKKFRLVIVGVLGQITVNGVCTYSGAREGRKKALKNCKEFGSNVKGCTRELNASRQA